MKNFKPFWFLEDPLDTEHKYYLLMSLIVDLKSKLGKKGFEKKFKQLLSIKKDLFYFSKETEFTQRTMISMTEEDRNLFYELLDKNLKNIHEIDSIVNNSLKVIENFIEENRSVYEYYNSLVEIETFVTSHSVWDQGFLVVRKEKEKHLKIFNWFFSIIKIDQKEKAALLMTEMLDPKCQFTKDLNTIKEFLKENVSDFSDRYDCVLIANISQNTDLEVGTEIGKEKSIEIILNNFRNI